MNILFLILGLILILVGANALTDGASALAKKWGMSDLTVGLTVVAFGTSAPELVISVMSAIEGNSGIAIGNVVGSNIFNVCAIVGITAMVRPIKVSKGIMQADIPLVVLASLVLLVMGNAVLLDGTRENILTRVNGIVLLLFFLIFMYHTFREAKSAEANNGSEDETKIKSMPLWKAFLWVAGGLAGLIYGGDRFVAGASGLASALGVSDAVIGLTIVAAGTSLPELATSITAAIKGKTGIAIGNVIGSNIFNIFLVLGCSSTVSPLAFGSVGNVDLLTLVGTAILFWLFGFVYKERTITRLEGALLLLCYIGYMTWTVVG